MWYAVGMTIAELIAELEKRPKDAKLSILTNPLGTKMGLIIYHEPESDNDIIWEVGLK